MDLNMTTATIYGEYIRDCLLESKPPLLKTRRQLFRSYPHTFVGNEIVNWMVKEHENEKENNNKSAEAVESKCPSFTEDSASQILQTLTDFGIIHSVHGEIPFKNDTSLYRFTADDGSSCGLVEAVVKGRRLHERTLCPDCTLFKRVCEYGDLVSDKCMRGSDLIDWILNNKLAINRQDATRLCKLMFEHGVIKPASSSVSEFIDGRPFYIFGIDYTSPPMTTRMFWSLWNSNEPVEIHNRLKNANGPNRSLHVRQLSGQLQDLSVQGTQNTARRKYTSSSCSDDSGYIENANGAATQTYESLLKSDGNPSPEGLLHANAPFVKKELRMIPDRMGYGFVIRGNSPCHVRVVDPESPAGKSGLKAWQYISKVNDLDVTRKTHEEIANIILSGPKMILMTVMVPKDEAGYARVQQVNSKVSQPEVQFPKPFNDCQRRQSCPVTPKTHNFPSAQPWMKQHRKASDYGIMHNPGIKFINY